MIIDKKLPSHIGNIKSIKTFGDSMLPILFNGDVIIHQKIKFSNIKINDIICFKKNNHLVTHRVVYRKSNFLITSGDNNRISDGKIYSKDVIGIVNKIKRIGHIISINDLYLIQSTIYFKEIIDVNRLLKKRKINIVVLKGLPLYLLYYNRIPKRIYADCDILVPRKKVNQVIKLMEKLGYKTIDTSFSKLQSKLKSQDTEITLYKLIQGIPVYFDIHVELGFMMVQIGKLNEFYSTKLLNKLTLSFINQSRQVKLNGESFNFLSPEHLVIYLILHLYHHNFTGPYRYDLLLNILNKEKLDYNKIAACISEFNLKNYIYPGVLLLKKYYNLKFESKFIEKIIPDKKILNLIVKKFGNLNIFDEHDRFSNGVEKFKLLFYLSPRKIYKYAVILNPEVIYFALLFVLLSAKSLFLKYRLNKSI